MNEKRDRHHSNETKTPAFHRVSLIADLARSAGRFAFAAAGLELDGTALTQGRGAWSAVGIVRHLAAADAIQTPRVMQILVRPGVRLPAFEEGHWAKLMLEIPTHDVLEGWFDRRRELVRLLSRLDSAALGTAGQLEEFGQISVSEVCFTLISHEQEQWEQLHRV